MCFWCKCNCFKKQNAEKINVLKAAQSMKRTKNNNVISKHILQHFSSKAQLEETGKKYFEFKILLCDKYSNLTQVSKNLYLTGVGGICTENIRDNGIKSIVNVSWELPKFEIPGIQTIRVPVDDDPSEDIGVYFEEVTAQIDKWISHQKGVLVHCLCGVSRSVTIVLAYLIKYKAMTLKSAFMMIFKIRDFIRPNLSFMRQLVDYEFKLFRKNSVKMINLTTRNGEVVSVPDLYLHLFPDETKERSAKDTTIDSVYTTTNTSRLDILFQ